jgi:hypothetical protein
VTEIQWKAAVTLPLNLTVRFGPEVLDAEDPGPWCQQRAAELLGPGAGRKQAGQLASCLLEYAGYCRSGNRPAIAAMFFYPDFSRLPPRAMSEVYLLVEDEAAGPMTIARGRKTYAPKTDDEAAFGQTELTETEVPAGPALRVHRFRRSDPGQRRSTIIEEVVWLICPPGSTQAALMVTDWGETAFSQAAISIADDMAQNFRVEPAGLTRG